MSEGIVIGTFDDSNTTSDPSIACSDDDDIVVGIMVGVVLPGACEGSSSIITRAGSGVWLIWIAKEVRVLTDCKMSFL